MAWLNKFCELKRIQMNSNEYKILELLNKERGPLFFREISKKANVSIGGTQKVLKDYAEFLNKEINGKNTYYSLKDNLISEYLKKILENKKCIEFIKKNKKLNEFISRLVKDTSLCLVFGSYARGQNTSNSDFDLIIITSKEIPEHLCPVKLHIVKLDKKSFEEMLKKDALGLEIIKDHIVFKGLDYFMEVVNKYGKN